MKLCGICALFNHPGGEQRVLIILSTDSSCRSSDAYAHSECWQSETTYLSIDIFIKYMFLLYGTNLQSSENNYLL